MLHWYIFQHCLSGKQSVPELQKLHVKNSKPDHFFLIRFGVGQSASLDLRRGGAPDGAQRWQEHEADASLSTVSTAAFTLLLFGLSNEDPSAIFRIVFLANGKMKMWASVRCKVNPGVVRVSVKAHRPSRGPIGEANQNKCRFIAFRCENIYFT